MGRASRQKGKRGERAWVLVLRDAGYGSARRTSQFCGQSGDASDVVCEELPWVHWEVKVGKNQPNIQDAIDQAKRDAAGRLPVVAHKKDHCDWLITLRADDFMNFLGGVYPPENAPKK